VDEVADISYFWNNFLPGVVLLAMKAIKQLITAILAVAALSSTAVADSGWLTDVHAGIVKAKKEGKAVMVEFTGSDWCPPCIMMHKRVFSKKEFTTAASKKYVLVKIDIPHGDRELYVKNQKVLDKYGVGVVPTVILLGNDGKEFDRFTASRYPTVDEFLAKLKSALEKKDMD